MNILYFKYAIEVERTGSISKAAQNLYMAQPNLSKALKDLEETLGYSVFIRNSQGVTPTDNGVVFLSYAKNILEQLDELKSITMGEKKKKKDFKIAIPRGSYITNGFTEFVAEISNKEKIDIYLKETHSLQAITDIVEGGYQLGIIRYQQIYETYFLDYLQKKGLVHDTIWEYYYVLVMSKEHPLAEKETIFEEDLTEYTEIFHGDIEIPFIHDLQNSNKDKEESSNRIYIYERGSQFDLLTNVPTTYMWVSPIPQKYLDQHGLVQRFCQIPNNIYKDLLIYRKGYQLSELDMIFQMKLYQSKLEVSSKTYK